MVNRFASSMYRSPSNAAVQPRAPMSGGTYGTLSRRASPGFNSASPFGYRPTGRPTMNQRPQGMGIFSGTNQVGQIGTPMAGMPTGGLPGQLPKMPPDFRPRTWTPSPQAQWAMYFQNNQQQPQSGLAPVFY